MAASFAGHQRWKATLRSLKNDMLLLLVVSFFPSWPPSSRSIPSPSPLALPHHFADIRRWTYLDGSALQLHPRRLGNELNCVIQIARFKHLNSTQLLLRFRVRTVCHCNLFRPSKTRSPPCWWAEEVPQRPNVRSSAVRQCN